MPRQMKLSALAGFDAFWLAYPRRDARKDAEKAWAALSPSSELQAQILAALAWQRGQHDWIKSGGQFVPLPASYLRGERWRDERRSVERRQISKVTEAALRAIQEAGE